VISKYNNKISLNSCWGMFCKTRIWILFCARFFRKISLLCQSVKKKKRELLRGVRLSIFCLC